MNFVDSIKTISNLNPSNNKQYEEISGLIRSLMDKIEKLNNEVNSFYSKMGILKLDYLKYDRKTTGGFRYYPEGANEFSRRFLKQDYKERETIKYDGTTESEFYKDPETEQQIILDIFNCPASLNQLAESYRKSLNTTIQLDQEDEKFIKEMLSKQVFNRKLGFSSSIKKGILTTKVLENMLYSLFDRNRSGREYIFQITYSKKANFSNWKNRKEKIEDWLKKNLQKEMGDWEKHLRSEDTIKKIKNYFQERFLRRSKYFLSKVIEDYINNYFEREVKFRLSRNLTAQEKWLLTRTFMTVFKEYKEDFTLNTVQKSSLVGFIGEFGYQFSMEYLNYNNSQLSNYVQGEFKLVGQQYITKLLRQEKLLRQGKYTQIINKNNKQQNPSDIIFYTKDGEEYRFQLKNSFDNTEASFSVQSPIHLNTFLPTALNGNRDILSLMRYVIVNVAFLEKYGLTSYDYNNSQALNMPLIGDPFNLDARNGEDILVISKVIQYLISLTYDYLLGYKFTEVIQKNYSTTQKVTKGNIAFIYQDKYFIPVAAFYATILELLCLIQDYIIYDNVDALNNIQNVTGIDTLITYIEEKNTNNLVKTTFPDADNFQTNKIMEIMKTISAGGQAGYNMQNTQYGYPDNLVEIGRQAGLKAYQSLKLKVNIKLNIKSLNSLLKEDLL